MRVLRGIAAPVVPRRSAGWLGGLFALLVLGACGDEKGSGPAKGAPGTGGAVGDGPVRHVLLVETNRDTFPAELGDEDEDEHSVVEVAGGTIRIDGDLARETDPARLAEAGVRLHDPAVPLGRCRLIVEHRTTFEGRGRWGGAVEVHGFPGDSGELELPAAPAGGEVVVNPASPEGGPFWARSIRVHAAPRLTLSVAGDVLTVAAGTERREVRAGEAAELPARTVSLRVREREVPWSEVETGPDEGAPLSGAFLPAVDHGTVEFRTTLSVRFTGPVAPAKPRPEPAGLGDDDR